MYIVKMNSIFTYIYFYTDIKLDVGLFWGG